MFARKGLHIRNGDDGDGDFTQDLRISFADFVYCENVLRLIYRNDNVSRSNFDYFQFMAFFTLEMTLRGRG